MTSGIELIAAERQRQIDEEGYGIEHDSNLQPDALASAAVVYAMPEKYGQLLAFWPWDLSHYKPKDRLTNLIRAGALIAAEIDRLQGEQE